MLRISTNIHATIYSLQALPLMIHALIMRKRIMEAVTMLFELEYYSEEDIDNTGNIQQLKRNYILVITIVVNLVLRLLDVWAKIPRSLVKWAIMNSAFPLLEEYTSKFVIFFYYILSDIFFTKPFFPLYFANSIVPNLVMFLMRKYNQFVDQSLVPYLVEGFADIEQDFIDGAVDVESMNQKSNEVREQMNGQNESRTVPNRTSKIFPIVGRGLVILCLLFLIRLTSTFFPRLWKADEIKGDIYKTTIPFWRRTLRQVQAILLQPEADLFLKILMTFRTMYGVVGYIKIWVGWKNASTESPHFLI